jgi:serine/threonine protein kinase
MIGEILGHYRLVAKLGEGGMGEVFRAVDTKLGRTVALKILPRALASDPERLARFEREARSAAALNHPNIVTLHSVEQANGIHFLTMELVDGESLAEAIPVGGLALGRILALGGAVAEALAGAHYLRFVVCKPLRASQRWPAIAKMLNLRG